MKNTELKKEIRTLLYSIRCIYSKSSWIYKDLECTIGLLESDYSMNINSGYTLDLTEEFHELIIRIAKEYPKFSQELFQSEYPKINKMISHLVKYS